MTPKEKKCCEEYLIDLNVTQSAIRAGYNPRSAHVAGSRVLSKPECKAYVQSVMNARAKRTNIDQDAVLNEIGKLAFSDVRSIFDQNGNLLPVHLLPDAVAASISSIDVVSSQKPGRDATVIEYTSKIRFWDKRGSLELLGKHLKMFTDKHEITGKDGEALKMEATITLTAEEAYKRMLDGAS